MGFIRKLKTPPTPDWMKEIKKEVDKSRCRNCKTELKEGTNFCPSCGLPTHGVPAFPMMPPPYYYPKQTSGGKKGGDSDKKKEEKKNIGFVGFLAIVVVIVIVWVIFNNIDRQPTVTDGSDTQEQTVTEDTKKNQRAKNDAVISEPGPAVEQPVKQGQGERIISERWEILPDGRRRKVVTKVIDGVVIDTYSPAK